MPRPTYTPRAGIIATVITRGLKTRFQFQPHRGHGVKGPLRKSEASAEMDAMKQESRR